jgi:glycogen operon protein
MSWVDWTSDPAAEDLTKVVRDLIALRAQVGALRAPRFPEPGPAGPSEPVAETGLAWFDPDGVPVASQDWDNAEGHSFAVVFAEAPSALVMLNAFWEPVRFSVPSPPSGAWAMTVDTTQEDGASTATGPLAAGASITVGPRSVIIATA